MRSWFLRLFIFLIWSWAKSVSKREKPMKNIISDCESSVRRAGGRMKGITEIVHAVEATIGRPDLVLAADVFLEHLPSDADCLAAEVAL